MKKVVCKNCGGEFSNKLSACPYCGSMYKKGAYANFRRKVSDFIDRLLGLKTEVDKSTSAIIISSIFRAIFIGVFVIALALSLALFRNTNYYNDKQYDEKRLKDIIWQNENISKLDEAYKNNDFNTIEKLYYENSNVVYNWQHYASYYLKHTYHDILEGFNGELNEYLLHDCLLFLYNPDYLARTNKMSLEEIEEYLTNKDVVLNKLIELGYSESQLQNIYDTCKDEYGSIRYRDLEKYVKGENNG